MTFILSIMSISVASSSGLISLTKPFTPTTLKTLARILTRNPSNNLQKGLDPSTTGKINNAAVLIPLCNVAGEPSILLEVRAKSLRSHSGEISFPGGRIDETDESFLYGALRETHEELGVHPARVEVLGEIGPPEFNARGDLCVWPFVGFVHSASDNRTTTADDEPLPSLDIDAIRQQVSPSEVATAFHLPLKSFTSPTRLRSSLFRLTRPYWEIDVTDLVKPIISEDLVTRTINEEGQEVGAGSDGKIEVWGLTGWYLTLLMKSLQVYQ
ncbi:NUDIX hydrolase domain-like protein [Panaeolus papilionaceus]|nr:NUDIX hydrolase domain-like protein [Panaeolus papilionaceus]